MKICRGEMFPYDYTWEKHKRGTWIFKVCNSPWLKERFEYEQKHYGRSYEFGGNVEEMLTDFTHYLFSFHDEFIEVIARGFWFEESKKSLLGKKLTKAHPFLPLPQKKIKYIVLHNKRYRVTFNPLPIETLIENTHLCEQKVFEVSHLFEGEYMKDQTLVIMRRNGKVMSILRGFFGRSCFEKKGIATFDEIQHLL